jgi:MFS family permease
LAIRKGQCGAATTEAEAPAKGEGPRARPALYTRDYFLLCLANFGVFGAFHIWTPVLPYYVLAGGGQDSDVGMAVAVMSAGSLPARLLVGALVDRLGKRLLLLGGGAVFLLAVAAHAAAGTVPLIAGARLLLGVGFAAFTGAAIALVADLAPAARRGEGLAVYSMSANVGQAIAPAASVALYAAAGFGPVMLLATLSALGMVVAVSLVRVPAGAPQGMGAARAPLFRPGNLIVVRALLPALLILFLFGCLGSIIAYVPLYATQRGLPNVGLFFTAFAVATLLARVRTGWLSDRFGRQVVVVPGVCLVLASLALLAWAPEPWLFFVAAALFGAGFGAAQPALVAFTVDRTPPERRGAATSTSLLATDVGIIMFVPLFGLLVPSAGYPGVFLAAAATLLGRARALCTCAGEADVGKRG